MIFEKEIKNLLMKNLLLLVSFSFFTFSGMAQEFDTFRTAYTLATEKYVPVFPFLTPEFPESKINSYGSQL